MKIHPLISFFEVLVLSFVFNEVGSDDSTTTAGAGAPKKPVYEGNGLKDAPITEACAFPELELKPPAGSKATNFKIIRKRLNWKDAHHYCEREIGQMATFEDEQDAKDIVEAIFSISYFDQKYDQRKKFCEYGLDRRYWIGLTDLSEEGKWKWVGKGKPLNYNSMWTRNQPDHVNQDGTSKSGRLQHCVILWNPAYWKHDGKGKKLKRHTFDDLECDQKHYFLCKQGDRSQNLQSGYSSGGGKGKTSNCPVSQPSMEC